MKSSVNSIGFLSPSRHAIVEPLENRRLMSGNWSTVHSDANGAGIQAMAADKAGNVYAISIENNSDGSTVPTLIEKTAVGQWMTLLTGGANQGLNAVATDKSGNVFVAGQVAGHLAIWEQAANQSGFSMIDNLSDRSSARAPRWKVRPSIDAHWITARSPGANASMRAVSTA